MPTEVSVVSITEVIVEYFSIFPVGRVEECFDLEIDFSELNEVYCVGIRESLARLGRVMTILMCVVWWFIYVCVCCGSNFE